MRKGGGGGGCFRTEIVLNIKREGEIMMVIKYRALALLPGEGGEDYK